jgi:hypothetical protein
MLHALERWIRRFAQFSLGFVVAFLAVTFPIGTAARRTLIRACHQLSDMGRTIRISGQPIRVSEEFYERVKTRQEETGESLEEAVRHEAGGPHPGEVVGLFTEEEAERMKNAVEELRSRDRSRLERAREAFSEDE